METSVESRLQAARRRGVVAALHRLPNTTLAELSALFERGGNRAALLGAVTVRELIAPARAEQCTGEDFDSLVHEVLNQAAGPVGAAYLRARVGGPRWKLQATLGRLVDAGKVARRGVTRGTCYWAVS